MVQLLLLWEYQNLTGQLIFSDGQHSGTPLHQQYSSSRPTVLFLLSKGSFKFASLQKGVDLGVRGIREEDPIVKPLSLLPPPV